MAAEKDAMFITVMLQYHSEHGEFAGLSLKHHGEVLLSEDKDPVKLS